VVGRAVLLFLLVGCGRAAHPAAQRSPPAASTTRPVIPARPPAIRATGASDGLIDATFDLEARGGRPTWSPPPAVAGGIRITLESLGADARLCFAGSLDRAVRVAFTVTPDGRASDVFVESDRQRARDCVAGALRRAVFPLSRRGWRIAHAFRL
jgi:hypothetical protein